MGRNAETEDATSQYQQSKHSGNAKRCNKQAKQSTGDTFPSTLTETAL